MKTHAFLAAALAVGLAAAHAQDDVPVSPLLSPNPAAASAEAEARREAEEASAGAVPAETPASQETPAPASAEPPAAPETAEAPAAATGTTETTVVTETVVTESVEAPAAGADPVPEASTFQPGVDEPLPLIPEAPLSPQEPLPSSSFGGIDAGSAGEPLKKGTADQLRQAIRVRELKTVALTDPAIQAQLAAADHARTYEGRRTALRNYYTLLTRKIIKSDPELRELLEGELRTKLASLEQHRVRPSKLIEPIKPIPGSSSADYSTKPAKP